MNDEGSIVWPFVKTGLTLLGGLVALGLILSLIRPVLMLATVAGVGYLSYRIAAGWSGRALSGASERRALNSGDDDFSRRMAELDRIDRQLDAEIRKHS